MDGQGIRPADYNPMIETIGAAENRRHLEAVRAGVAQAAAQLPPITVPQPAD
jgi:tryptophan halogenase